MRDPRDVIVSECFFVHMVRCVKARLIQYSRRRLPIVTAWIATRYHWHSTKLPNNSVFVWYDALAAGSRDEYQKLFDVLGVPCTEQDIEVVKEACAPKVLLSKGISVNNIRSAGRTNFLDHGLSNDTLVAMEDVLRRGLPEELQKIWNVYVPKAALT